jgi:hypothetical protein
MSRRIVWSAYESSDSEGKIDGYFDRLLKYIPSDVVGLWLAGSGLKVKQTMDREQVYSGFYLWWV